MNELWKIINDYEDYAISNIGRVKRVTSDVSGTIVSKILRPIHMKRGYLRICLCKNGKPKRFLVHRLVAMAFIGKPKKGETQTNHKNGIKDDNRPENLEWCTAKQNAQHSIHVLGNSIQGEKHGKAKMTEKQVLEIRKLYTAGNYLQKELAKMFGISQSHAGNIINRNTWTHI